MTQATTIGSNQEETKLRILMLLVHNETQEDKNNFFLIVNDYVNHDPKTQSIAESLIFKVYHINSHTCPSNWMGGRPFIGDDTDPHGIFKFVAARVVPTKEEMQAEYPGVTFDWSDKEGELVVAGDLSRNLTAKEIKKFFGVPDTEITWDCPTTLELTDDGVLAGEKMITYLPGVLEVDYEEHEEQPEAQPALPEATAFSLGSDGEVQTMDFDQSTKEANTNLGSVSGFVEAPPAWAGADSAVPQFEFAGSLLSDTKVSCFCGGCTELELLGDLCPVCGQEVKVISDGIVQAVIDPPPPVLENYPVQPGDENLDRGQLIDLVPDAVGVGRGLKHPLYPGSFEKLKHNDQQDPQKHLHDQLMGNKAEEPKETHTLELRPGVSIELIAPTESQIKDLPQDLARKTLEQRQEERAQLVKNLPDGPITGWDLTPPRARVTGRRTVEIKPREEVKRVFTTEEILDRVPGLPTKEELVGQSKRVAVELSKRYPFARGNPGSTKPYQRGVPTESPAEQGGRKMSRVEEALMRGIDPASPRPRINPERGGIPAYAPPVRAYGESEVRIQSSYAGGGIPKPEEQPAQPEVDITSKIDLGPDRIRAASPMADQFSTSTGISMNDLGGGSVGAAQPGGFKADDDDNDFDAVEGNFNDQK